MAALRRFMRFDPVAAAVVAVLAGAGGAPAAVPGIPSIHINYSANCTFTMTVDPGIPVTSSSGPGPTLPPGQYELAVFMPNPVEGYVPCERPSFSLTGPGVRAVSQFRGEELVDEHLLPPLQPSSTYVAEDGNAPGQTRRIFRPDGPRRLGDRALPRASSWRRSAPPARRR